MDEMFHRMVWNGLRSSPWPVSRPILGVQPASVVFPKKIDRPPLSKVTVSWNQKRAYISTNAAITTERRLLQ